MSSPSPLTLALAALLFAGCDEVYGLTDHDDIDAAMQDDGATDTGDASDAVDAPSAQCITEEFSTTFADIAFRWERYEGTGQSPAFVDVVNGRLTFSLPPSVSVPNAAGVTLIAPVDFTGATMQAEIVDATTHPPNFKLFVKLFDDDARDRYYEAFVEDEFLNFDQVTGAIHSLAPKTAFDPITHRFWRVRHRADLAKLVLETSADNITYTERASHLAANVSLGRLRLEIGSGTDGSQGMLLKPIVDNFAFCPAP